MAILPLPDTVASNFNNPLFTSTCATCSPELFGANATRISQLPPATISAPQEDVVVNDAAPAPTRPTSTVIALGPVF